MKEKKLLLDDYVCNIHDESCKKYLKEKILLNDNSDYKDVITKIIYILKKSEQEIKNNIDKNFDLNLISYDDKNIFEYIKNNKIENVFVFNNFVEKNKTKINNLNDISILFSINDFIYESFENSFNKTKIFINKLNSDIKNIIEDFNDILIFQEDFLKIINNLTGWNLSKCDDFRRTLAKKNAEQINLLKLEFVTSLKTNGFDEITSKELFDTLLYFADKLTKKSFAILNARFLYQWYYLGYYYKEIFDNIKLMC